MAPGGVNVLPSPLLSNREVVQQQKQNSTIARRLSLPEPALRPAAAVPACSTEGRSAILNVCLCLLYTTMMAPNASVGTLTQLSCSHFSRRRRCRCSPCCPDASCVLGCPHPFHMCTYVACAPLVQLQKETDHPGAKCVAVQPAASPRGGVVEADPGGPGRHDCAERIAVPEARV